VQLTAVAETLGYAATAMLKSHLTKTIKLNGIQTETVIVSNAMNLQKSKTMEVKPIPLKTWRTYDFR
jgi:DNA-binding FrmR family transcriptional regulator